MINTRWFDAKGTNDLLTFVAAWRRRLENATKTEEESANIFASTPPLEAVTFLISEAMTTRASRNNR